jgi:hypothetical protein
MDRYHGELEIEGREAPYVVDIAEPLNPSGWQSLTIAGVDLSPGMASAGPFRVRLVKPGDPHDGWTGMAMWRTGDNGESWCLGSDGPLSAP